MDSRTASYTAANAFPFKLCLDPEFATGRIPPRHVQLSLTNVCNMACSFCSCGERDRSLELPTAEAEAALRSFAELGTRAVTITGGGEPLLHPGISSIIQAATDAGIRAGLVTNGMALDDFSREAMRRLTWCRVSCSDEVDNRILEPKVRRAAADSPEVDWAFSYVVVREHRPENLARYLRLAEELRFTHVRVVSDLVDLEGAPPMVLVRELVRNAGADDRLAIYQGRKSFEPGAPICLISLLKPVVGPDGGIFPCCGVQYAEREQTLDLPGSMRMGGLEDVGRIWRDQAAFDGSACVRCYYGEYNRALAVLTDNIRHREFV